MAKGPINVTHPELQNWNIYSEAVMAEQDVKQILEALKRPFPVDLISWRVGATTSDKSKGIALAYIDARDVMKRLDDVVGAENWQDDYPWSEGGRLVCRIGLRLGGEWVWKANGAGDTQVEAEKGAFSDAFKRAAVMWGIGRYLYMLPNVWVPLETKGRSHVIKQAPALPAWATPEGYDAAMKRRAAA